MVNSDSRQVLKVNGDLRDHKGIANYTKHWNADSSKDSAEQMEARKASYTEVVNNCELLQEQTGANQAGC